MLDGASLGDTEGRVEGLCDSTPLGTSDGNVEGRFEGPRDGDEEERLVGEFDAGVFVGAWVGGSEIDIDGAALAAVGDSVGSATGTRVGD